MKIFKTVGLLAFMGALAWMSWLVMARKDPCKMEGQKKGCESAISVLIALFVISALAHMVCIVVVTVIKPWVSTRFPGFRKGKIALKAALKAVVAIGSCSFDMLNVSSYTCLGITLLLFVYVWSLETDIPRLRRVEYADTLLSMVLGISLTLVLKHRLWLLGVCVYSIIAWKYYSAYTEPIPDLESGQGIQEEELFVLGQTTLVADARGRIYNEVKPMRRLLTFRWGKEA